MICQAISARNYLQANDIYLALAIGNSPWPIGVTQVRGRGQLLLGLQEAVGVGWVGDGGCSGPLGLGWRGYVLSGAGTLAATRFHACTSHAVTL